MAKALESGETGGMSRGCVEATCNNMQKDFRRFSSASLGATCAGTPFPLLHHLALHSSFACAILFSFGQPFGASVVCSVPLPLLLLLLLLLSFLPRILCRLLHCTECSVAFIVLASVVAFVWQLPLFTDTLFLSLSPFSLYRTHPIARTQHF